MNLSADVQSYLAAGGTINILPGYQEQPRRPHSAPAKAKPVPEKKKDRKIPEWHQRDMCNALIHEARITRQALAKASGVPVQRLCMFLDGTFNPMSGTGRQIEAAVIKLSMAKRKRGE